MFLYIILFRFELLKFVLMEAGRPGYLAVWNIFLLIIDIFSNDCGIHRHFLFDSTADFQLTCQLLVCIAQECAVYTFGWLCKWTSHSLIYRFDEWHTLSINSFPLFQVICWKKNIDFEYNISDIRHFQLRKAPFFDFSCGYIR